MNFGVSEFVVRSRARAVWRSVAQLRVGSAPAMAASRTSTCVQVLANARFARRASNALRMHWQQRFARSRTGASTHARRWLRRRQYLATSWALAIAPSTSFFGFLEARLCAAASSDSRASRNSSRRPRNRGDDAPTFDVVGLVRSRQVARRGSGVFPCTNPPLRSCSNSSSTAALALRFRATPGDSMGAMQGQRWAQISARHLHALRDLDAAITLDDLERGLVARRQFDVAGAQRRHALHPTAPRAP